MHKYMPFLFIGLGIATIAAGYFQYSYSENALQERIKTRSYPREHRPSSRVSKGELFEVRSTRAESQQALLKFIVGGIILIVGGVAYWAFNDSRKRDEKKEIARLAARAEDAGSWDP